MKKPSTRQDTSPLPTQDDMEDLRQVLRHVGALASTAVGITRDRALTCASLDDLHQQLQVMQYLVDRIGWMSDVGLRKLGDSGSLARAEDWMLPAV